MAIHSLTDYSALNLYHIRSDQISRSVVSDSLRPHEWIGSTPGLPINHQLPEFTETHIHRVNDAIQPSHPLSSPSPYAFSLSQHQGLFQESALCITWPKYWTFISPSNEYLGLISIRRDWLDLLSVQGILKSLHQHHISKPSILWCSAFFSFQCSHSYMTTRKTIA